MTRVEHLSDSVTLYLGDCREILPTLGRVDHVITDPPYSARTHTGHDGSSAGSQRDGHNRQSLGYEPLSPVACGRLASLFNAATPGWIVWMTDDVLAPVIQAAMTERGRKVFAPLPFFQPGRSVRLSGDGPCSWTDWIICSRTPALKKWGTLPGGYVAGEGWSDKERMGGKPTRLMTLLVQHYSRAGETICDPFMGGGTTGVACAIERRGFVGIEIDAPTFDRACRRIEQELRRPRFELPPQPPLRQEALEL